MALIERVDHSRKSRKCQFILHQIGTLDSSAIYFGKRQLQGSNNRMLSIVLPLLVFPNSSVGRKRLSAKEKPYQPKISEGMPVFTIRRVTIRQKKEVNKGGNNDHVLDHLSIWLDLANKYLMGIG